MRSPPPAKPGEINYATVDRFTLVHAGIGVAYELLGLSFLLALVLAIAWELIENPLKAYLPWVFPHATHDTLRNSIGDSVALMISWAVTYACTR
jgi:hypothetical protein